MSQDHGILTPQKPNVGQSSPLPRRSAMVTVTFRLSVRLIVAIPILLFSLGSWALGQETVLYNFTGGADGGQPVGTMVLDNAGNLYGATEAGGEFNKGTVFMVTA